MAGLFGLNEATWTGYAALASGVAAVATGTLACITWRLALETRNLVRADNQDRQQIQRHHEQALEPHIALYVEVDRANGEEWVMLRNIGPGYAKDIKLQGEIVGAQDIRIVNIPPGLGSGQACKYIQLLPSANHAIVWRRFSATYKDAFDNQFETVDVNDSNTHAFLNAAGYIFRRLGKSS